jgi:ferredoxin-NADP reductase
MNTESLRTTLGRGLMLGRDLEFWLGEVNARWSVRETRARVVTVVNETRDVKTFVLRPNAGWRGHRAGQYATVEVEIAGVRVRRCYSMSSAPADPLVSFTVKRAQGGKVSRWLHDRVRAGDVLRLGPASGDFVLPEPAPARLLLLSGGSGITPVMSILRDLAARGAVGDVVMLHYARSRADVIFGRELASLAASHPGLRVVFGLDDAAARGPAGRSTRIV